ncbi:MAG: hypothetical protein ACREIC_00075, partial [Limisphaerales bacterium]
WLDRALNPLALVALFDTSRGIEWQTRPTRTYLADAARRGRMEFFAQPDSTPYPGPEPRFASVPSEDAGLNARTLSALAGVVKSDAGLPRWGINE